MNDSGKLNPLSAGADDSCPGAISALKDKCRLRECLAFESGCYDILINLVPSARSRTTLIMGCLRIRFFLELAFQ